MGWGDEIMAAGQVTALRRAMKEAGEPVQRVAVLDRHGRPRWHAAWENNPRVCRPGDWRDGAPAVVNGSGCRPYVDYGRTTPDRWAYTDWRCEPGELWLSARELCFGRERTRGVGPFVLIEPHVKASASPNKRWGMARCQALLDRLPQVTWVQTGAPGTEWLRGVVAVETPGFREAAAVLAGARGAVLPEGGLHHAAAALGVPAVVIFGGMTSPANTGYDAHVNLTDGRADSPCGWRKPCDHCAAAMAAITPELVAAAVVGNLLNDQPERIAS